MPQYPNINLFYLFSQFRVAIFLSGRSGTGEPVFSAPSVVISTLESGKPSSAPSSLRAAAPDPSRVAISWEPGPFPNGPLISYVLRLADTQPNTNDALEVSTFLSIGDDIKNSKGKSSNGLFLF